MTASPTLLLLFYCAAVAGFSLVGGLLPNWVKMTHTRTQLVMSFVSGLMLGVALFHLFPHSVIMVGGAGAVGCEACIPGYKGIQRKKQLDRVSTVSCGWYWYFFFL